MRKQSVWFQFGISVATAGDVNGDGYSDVIVGARFDNGQSNEGMVSFTTARLQDFSASANWTEERNQASSSFCLQAFPQQAMSTATAIPMS